MKIVKILFYSIFGTLALALLIFKLTTLPPDINEEARHAATLPGPKIWYEASRVTIVSEGEDVNRYTLWRQDPIALPADQRAYVEGRFAASEIHRLLFVVMDATNYQRMTQGFPPFVLYSSRTSPVRFALPTGEWWAGFIALPKTEESQPTFPASMADLILLVLQQAAKGAVPPVRVTLELDRVTQAYGERSRSM